MEKELGIENPFAAARRVEKRVTVNKVSGYTDIMLDNLQQTVS